MRSDTPTIPNSVEPDDMQVSRYELYPHGTERRVQRTATAPPIWPYPPPPRPTPAPGARPASGSSGCAAVASAFLTLLVGVLVGVAVGRASVSLLPSQNMTNVFVPHVAPLMQPAATATATVAPTPTPLPTDTPVPTATPDTFIPDQAGVALSRDAAAALITQYYNCCGPDQGEYTIAQIDALQLSAIDTTDIAACAQYQYAAASDPNTPQGTDTRTFTLRSLDGMTWHVTDMGDPDSCSLQNG